MSNVLTEQRTKLLSDCINSIKAAIDITHEYADKEGKADSFDKIKKLTIDFCELDKEFKSANRAMNDTVEFFNNEDNDCTQDVSDIYKNMYDKNLQTASQSNSHLSDPIWKTIDSAINKITYDKEGYEEEALDASIICNQSFNVPMDPLTKQAIEDACKNTVCNHVYEYKTIMAYIQSKKKRVRCPYVGCTNDSVSINHIVRDEELSQKIASTSFARDETNYSIVDVSM